MVRIFKIIFCFVIVDFFFFSTRLSFTFGFNTKELMAVVGIFLFCADLYQKRNIAITREFIWLLVFSGIISLLAFFSAVYHNTPERVYTTYFLSMLVWLSASFVVIECIKSVHTELSIELLATYIVAVATFQGLIAVIADNYEQVDMFIRNTVPGTGWLRTVDRLYGFGETATLDTGGIRFAIASVLCAHNIKVNVSKGKISSVPLYVLAFLIIGVTGNMVARTTLVGTAIGLVYLLVFLFPLKFNVDISVLKAWLWIIAEVFIIVVIVSSLYNSDEKFRSRTRFAFEGFFSIAEQGHWRTGSNDKLKSMYVFPDNPETWIIGDGYFINPEYDPNYVGELTEGYYKNTDVGYLRFIFFFGLIGLSVYSLFIIYAGTVCARMFPGNSLLFLALTSMNFVVWLKVATDCFFILCLFISMGYLKEGMMPKTSDNHPV